jgi:hypothetical protein
MSKHTPVPWECGPEIDSDSRLVYIPIRSQSTRIATTGVYGRKPNGKTTGKLYSDEFGIERHPPHITADECRANAERIVRCVNSHDDLLEAIRAAMVILSRLMEIDGYDGGVAGAVRLCELAIAKAEAPA